MNCLLYVAFAMVVLIVGFFVSEHIDEVMVYLFAVIWNATGLVVGIIIFSNR